MAESNSLKEYYARRASEYERVYEKPERQADLLTLAEMLSNAFAGQSVLEVACGTGYWTRFIARTARNILATDINPETLNIARQKDFGFCNVTLQECDAYSLVNIRQQFEAGFNGFWWSHIPLQKITEFLESFNARLCSGARVIMIDNSYVTGSSTPISRRDENGNTFQLRRLQDGSEHEVLKNFPSAEDLRNRLEPYARDVQVTQLPYYWIVQCKKK